MAPLQFDYRSFIFRSAIDRLRQAFRAACTGLDAEMKSIDADEVEYRMGPPQIDRDEDGVVIFDEGERFEYEREATAEALHVLRKTFVIAIYHEWERAARLWTGDGSNSSHDELVKALGKNLIQVDTRIEAVKDLANTLKHNSSKCGTRLSQTWPELMPRGVPPNQDFHSAIVLMEKHVEEVFAIVEQSAPAFRRP